MIWLWYDECRYDYDMDDRNSWTWFEIPGYVNTVLYISMYEIDNCGLNYLVCNKCYAIWSVMLVHV